MAAPFRHQLSGGPLNELHHAVRDGSIEMTVNLLASGRFDIDEASWSGATALMFAALLGHSEIVRILLNRRANISVVDANGCAALHWSALHGRVDATTLLLKAGSDPNAKGSTMGFTPLDMAAAQGYSDTMRVLIEAGADPNSRASDGTTSLYRAVLLEQVDTVKALAKAGADLEAKISTAGFTPLDAAAHIGRSDTMRVLIEAGADPNHRMLDGTTSLYRAARRGQVGTVKVLLRAKANPLLMYSYPSGATFVPLDVAAQNGHSEVVHELIEELGIEGCGGASGGVDALQGAAESQQVEVMEMLTSAGVVDTGVALQAAARWGRESSVKFLLQQQEWRASGEGAGYLQTCNPSGRTPILCSIEASRSCSPRITRLLVDAGADTTAAVRLAVRLADAPGLEICFDDTPLAYTDFYIREKKIERKIEGKGATERQLRSLEATRRLLMRVEAVHAVSWLWAKNAPSAIHPATWGSGRVTNAASPPLTVWRRAERPTRAILAALSR